MCIATSSRRRSSRFPGRIRLLLVPAAIIVVAACGSSKSTSNGAQSTPTSGGTTSNSSAVVMMSNSSTLGAFLTDANGMTLYTLTNAGHPVACTGGCATFWPPLLLPAGVTSAKGSAGVTGLGVVSMDGGMQVTAHGDPLYRFSKDKAPGDTNGQGISSFGGVWHVAATASALPANSPATTPPTTTSSYGGGGYGGGGYGG